MERLTPPVKITESEEQRILNKLRCSKEVCELFVGKSLSLGLVSRSMNNGIHLAFTTASTTTAGTGTGTRTAKAKKLTKLNTKESSDDLDLAFGLRVNANNAKNPDETDKVLNTTTLPATIPKVPSPGAGAGPAQNHDESDAPNLNPTSKSKYKRNHIKPDKTDDQKYQKYLKNHLRNPKAKFLPITSIIENGLETMEKSRADAVSVSSKSGLKVSDNNYNAEINQNRAKAKYDKTKIKGTEPQPPKANPGSDSGSGPPVEMETATTGEKNITKSKSREFKSKPRSQSIPKVPNQESKQPASVPVPVPVSVSAPRPRRPDRKNPPEQFPGTKPGLVFKPWGKGKSKAAAETDDEKVPDADLPRLHLLPVVGNLVKKHKQFISKTEDGNNSNNGTGKRSSQVQTKIKNKPDIEGKTRTAAALSRTPHGILQMIKSAFDYASPSSHNHSNDNKDKQKKSSSTQSSRITDNDKSENDITDAKQSSLEKSPFLSLSPSPSPTKIPVSVEADAQKLKLFGNAPAPGPGTGTGTGGPDNFQLNQEGQKQNADAFLQPPIPTATFPQTPSSNLIDNENRITNTSPSPSPAIGMDQEIKSPGAELLRIAESQKLLFRKHLTGTSIVASMAEESAAMSHSKQAQMDPRMDDLDELVRGPLFCVDGQVQGGRVSTAPSTSCISTMTYRSRRKIHHDAALLHGKALAGSGTIGVSGLSGLPNTATITSKTKGLASSLPGNKYTRHQSARPGGVKVRSGSGTYANAANRPFGQGADTDGQNGGARASKMPPPSFHATFSRRNQLSKKFSATVTATGGLIVDGGRGKMRRATNKFGTKYGLAHESGGGGGLGNNETENEGETPAELVALQHQKIIAAGLSHSYSHTRSRSRSHSKHKKIRRTAETEDHGPADPSASTDLNTSVSANLAKTDGTTGGIGTNAESTPTPANGANETLKKLPSRAKPRIDRDRDRDRETDSGNNGICSSISCSRRSRTRSPSPNPSPSPTPTRLIKDSHQYRRTKHSIKSNNVTKAEEEHASGKSRSPTVKSRRSAVSKKNIEKWDADDREFGHTGTSSAILNPNKKMLVGMRELVKAYEIQNLKNQKPSSTNNSLPPPPPPPVHPRSRKANKDERAEESSAVNLAVKKKPIASVLIDSTTIISTTAN